MQPHYMPTYPCGVTLTDLRTEAEITRWKSRAQSRGGCVGIPEWNCILEAMPAVPHEAVSPEVGWGGVGRIGFSKHRALFLGTGVQLAVGRAGPAGVSFASLAERDGRTVR